MERTDVQELVQHAALYNQKFDVDFQETHISWVLFTADFALKIKKPVKLTFLDFSTLELRKHFCEQEVKLNSRFSEIYLGVESLNREGQKWVIGSESRQVWDYGVVMQKQDNSLRMDSLLSKNQVSKAVIDRLAYQVADFHKDAVVISAPFELNKAKELFSDLQSVSVHFEKLPDKEWADLIEDTIGFSDEFLTENQSQFIARIEAGNVRDVHGDLHSRNIFLSPEPVIFDCIEFNDTFRQIDVWYEVAFLCMDIESYGHRELSEGFFDIYTWQKGELVNNDEMRIFTYFKMLRANVRAKVLAIQAGNEVSFKPTIESLSSSIHYLQLMKSYMAELRQF
ncbi:MAG TPA: phosphotransferase [Lunatimonas sp.]|nr:phosphotransferase [Lunatimonas sp.]